MSSGVSAIRKPEQPPPSTDTRKYPSPFNVMATLFFADSVMVNHSTIAKVSQTKTTLLPVALGVC